MEKSCKKCAPKASPRPLFNFGKETKTAIARNMQEILLKIRYFERGLSKSLKKLTLFFLSNPFFRSLLMDKIMKNKRGLELVTSHSSGYKISSVKLLY